MLDFLKKRPMLLGAVMSSVISVIGMYAGRTLFIICIVILCLIFVMVYKYTKGELVFAAICVLAVAVSTFFTTVKIESTKDYDKVACNGEFIVVETPENHGDYSTTTLETVSSDVLNKGDKISVVYYDGTLEIADRIKASLSVSSLKDNEFKNYNYSNKVYLSAYISEIVDTGEKEAVLSAVDLARQYIKEKIFKHYSFRQAATMLALITGDKTYFLEEFYENVKNAGVAHVMVVSGMHLSVVVSLFLFLSNKFFHNRYLKALTIFMVTVGVTAVCGFTMSILRAGITYLLLAAALIINRESTPENTLGCAVVVILVSNPFAIFNVGFQLSVLSTFAILVVALPVSEYVVKRKIVKNKMLLTMVTSCMISISALIFTSPITIYNFGYISNLSVVTNLLISAPASVAMILCILGICFPFEEDLFFGLGEVVVNYINWVINYFGSLCIATTVMSKYIAFVFLAVIIVVLWVLLACKKRKDVLKLNEIREEKLKERSNKVKWR